MSLTFAVDIIAPPNLFSGQPTTQSILVRLFGIIVFIYFFVFQLQNSIISLS